MAEQDNEPPETEALVRAFQQGAERSFEQLYARLAPALYAWTVLRARRGVDPGDLLGEVWLHAVRSVHNFDPARASFRAWIFGIAKKVLLHSIRDQQRGAALDARSGRNADPARVDLESVPDSVTSLSRRFEREDSMATFLERVNTLGREERDLVVYCGLEGFSCDEAATRLGLTSDATTKRWQRLRAELRGSTWAESLLA